MTTNPTLDLTMLEPQDLDLLLLTQAAKTKTKTVRAGWGGRSTGALQSGNSRAWTRGGDVD